MKDVLTDIQTGVFADAWIAEMEAGGGQFRRCARPTATTRSRRSAPGCAAQMLWLNPVEVQAGQAQASAAGCRRRERH